MFDSPLLDLVEGELVFVGEGEVGGRRNFRDLVSLKYILFKKKMELV